MGNCAEMIRIYTYISPYILIYRPAFESLFKQPVFKSVKDEFEGQWNSILYDAEFYLVSGGDVLDLSLKVVNVSRGINYEVNIQN